jgi:hypothetical protein
LYTREADAVHVRTWRCATKLERRLAPLVVVLRDDGAIMDSRTLSIS